MTESFILMAVGIAIGYSITLWRQRSGAATVAAIGPNTGMHSVAHAAASTEGSKIGNMVSLGVVTPAHGSQTATSAKSIDELVKSYGAEVVMFISGKKLTVVDATTGELIEPTRSMQHAGHHDAEIRFNDLGEPVLFDTKAREAMVVHEKAPGANGFREMKAISKRVEDACVIYFMRYTGSHCICTWSGGDHYVRCA